VIQFLSDPVPVNEGGRMYHTFVRTFWGRNFYSQLLFLTPTCITYQESGPIVAFYNRTAALLFSIRQSTVVCNKISNGETLLITPQTFIEGDSLFIHYQSKNTQWTWGELNHRKAR